MKYTVLEFTNIEELKKYDGELVKRLIKDVNSKETKWQSYWLYLYPTLVDLVKHEISEGLNIVVDNEDYESVGRELIEAWNDSEFYYDEETGCVIYSNYGW